MEEIFRLFCAENELREVMKNPFHDENGRSVTATNGYCLIRCDKELVDFEVNNTFKAYNSDEVFQPFNLSKVINIDESVFEPYKTTKEFKRVGEDVVCRECKGEGEVMWEYERWEREFECPLCEGSGCESEKKSVPTGRMIVGFNQIIKFGDAYFNYGVFSKLIEAQKLIGSEIVLLNTPIAQKAACFKIGVYEILIMPTIKSDDNDDEKIIDLTHLLD